MMSVYDMIECQYPLPDGFVPPPGTEWQTHDTPAQWLAQYRLAPDGTLSDGATCVPLPFHGLLTFYATNICGASPRGVITTDESAPWWAEYHCLYDHGRLLKIEGARRFDTTSPRLSRAEFYAREEHL